MNLNMAAVKDHSELVALRGLSDAELASEIEKADTATTELVNAHMSYVHGLGGTEKDSAAYYAARKCSKTARGPPARICAQTACVARLQAE